MLYTQISNAAESKRHELVIVKTRSKRYDHCASEGVLPWLCCLFSWCRARRSRTRPSRMTSRRLADSSGHLVNCCRWSWGPWMWQTSIKKLLGKLFSFIWVYVVLDSNKYVKLISYLNVLPIMGLFRWSWVCVGGLRYSITWKVLKGKQFLCIVKGFSTLPRCHSAPR